MPRERTTNTDGLIPITIRIPKEVHEWIKQRADKERRSFNSQIALDLERFMHNEQSSVTLAASGTVGKPSE